MTKERAKKVLEDFTEAMLLAIDALSSSEAEKESVSEELE